MRMLVRVTLPVEPFNTYVKDGSASAKMGRILGELKPEAAYFAEFDGHRTALLVIHMDDCSQIPVIAEPWFLTFNADCHFPSGHGCRGFGQGRLARSRQEVGVGKRAVER